MTEQNHQPHVLDREDGRGTPPAILARGISKRYTTKKRRQEAQVVALRNVDLQVDQGEFVTLVGPSGCGKTTLLKISAGLIRPTEGEVLWSGLEGEPQRRFGMMVFQSAALLPWRTVMNNVLFPATIVGTLDDRTRERARELLDRVQLVGVEDSYPDELSGGMQQRVAIARALLTDPEVLFMDEPFGALDAMTREELNVVLQDVQLRENKTVLFVTHNIQEAVFLSDRIIVMGAGPGYVKSEVKVPFPRPRTLSDMVSAEFRKIEHDVRNELDVIRDDPR